MPQNKNSYSGRVLATIFPHTHPINPLSPLTAWWRKSPYGFRKMLRWVLRLESQVWVYIQLQQS